MKHTFLTAAACLPLCLAAALPVAAQDLAALTPAPARQHSVDDDLITVSVMPVPPAKPASVKAAHNLRAGTVLHASDLLVDGAAADQDGDGGPLDLFVGMELKRAIYTGKVLTPNDVGPPTAIQRNAIVTLQFARGPLLITTEGRALDAGALGEAVRIMNLNSKIILTAVVAGPNKAVAQ